MKCLSYEDADRFPGLVHSAGALVAARAAGPDPFPIGLARDAAVSFGRDDFRSASRARKGDPVFASADIRLAKDRVKGSRLTPRKRNFSIPTRPAA